MKRPRKSEPSKRARAFSSFMRRAACESGGLRSAARGRIKPWRNGSWVCLDPRAVHRESWSSAGWPGRRNLQAKPGKPSKVGWRRRIWRCRHTPPLLLPWSLRSDPGFQPEAVGFRGGGASQGPVNVSRTASHSSMGFSPRQRGMKLGMSAFCGPLREKSLILEAR